MAQRLLFFGTDEFSVPTLRALLDSEFEVAAVVTKPSSVSGRGRSASHPPVKHLAEQNQIMVLQPSSFNDDVIKLLKEFNAVAAVVVSYGRIIPQSIIDLFPNGLINIHASLLPKYRGASPIEAAILNADDVTGISIMQINAGLDSGPVFVQAKLALKGNETKPELYQSLAKLGANTLINSLPQIIDGSLIAVPQDDSAATEVSIIKKSDGQIDWSQPAEAIERQVRAYRGWPGSQTRLLDREVTITSAHLDVVSTSLKPGEISIKDNVLAVGTASTNLIINRLKPAGKNEMPAADFMRGRTN